MDPWVRVEGHAAWLPTVGFAFRKSSQLTWRRTERLAFFAVEGGRLNRMRRVARTQVALQAAVGFESGLLAFRLHLLRCESRSSGHLRLRLPAALREALPQYLP